MAIDKAVDSTILNGYFTDIADAIRAKNGSSDTYYPADMAQAIEDLPIGADTLTALVKGEATGEVIINYKAHATNGPGVVIIMGNGYNEGITKLKMVCDDGAKDNQEISLIRTSTPLPTPFALEEIDFGNLEATRFGLGSLSGDPWPNLTKINAPKLKSTLNDWQYFLKYARALQSIKLPSMVHLSGSDFVGCTSLELVDLGNNNNVKGAYAAKIGSKCFSSCSSLFALVMRSPWIYALDGTGAFTNTPIASGAGYIYVPSALISDYESATNWSTYAGQFRAIEDYTADGTVDGEFIMPTA